MRRRNRFQGVEDCDDSGPSATCTNDCRFTDAFVSVWVTGLANETITLPLRSGFNYDFTVDWGDGSPTSQITGYDDPSRTHAYAVPGNHKIVITGTMETIYFNNGPERQKILEVSNLGDVGWTSFESAFEGCDRLKGLAGGETGSVLFDG